MVIIMLSLGSSVQAQMELKAGLKLPISMGSNFLNEAYTINPGAHLAVARDLGTKWSVALNYAFHSLGVIDPSIIGAIERTWVTQVSLSLSYKIYSNSSWWLSAQPSIGLSTYRHLQNRDRFRDRGLLTGFGLTTGHNLSPQLGIYVSLDLDFEFLQTKVNIEDRSYFRNTRQLVPRIGLYHKL